VGGGDLEKVAFIIRQMRLLGAFVIILIGLGCNPVTDFSIINNTNNEISGFFYSKAMLFEKIPFILSPKESIVIAKAGFMMWDYVYIVDYIEAGEYKKVKYNYHQLVANKHKLIIGKD
jgi:hypothetical protein